MRGRGPGVRLVSAISGPAADSPKRSRRNPAVRPASAKRAATAAGSRGAALTGVTPWFLLAVFPKLKPQSSPLNHVPSPRSFLPESHGVFPHRRRPHGAVQLAVRAPHGWHVHPARRGYRQGAQQPPILRTHLRGSDLAWPQLGRRPEVWREWRRELWPVFAERTGGALL